MEETSFLAAAEKYKDTVYRVALNFFGNTDDAVQDVLMKLYLSDRQFESDEHVRNWLIRVTVNVCKNTLRMPWRRKNVALEELSQSVPFEQKEESDLFLSVMSLPEKYRTVLYLFYYEEFSVREIAGIMKLKESAVTTRLSRARNELRLKLAEVWRNE